MYEQLLTQAGLSLNQATIYELLLREGELKASKISQKSPLKRGLVYKILDELVELQIVNKEELPNKPAKFEAEHPNKLREILKNKEESIERAKASIDKLLPQLASEYNLASGKPGITFFEGQAGAEKVAGDSLNSKTEVYTYLDPEAVDKYLKAFNLEYKKARKQKNIFKKILVKESDSNRERYKNIDRNITAVRLMDTEIGKFFTVMQIYDNKVSYITLTDKDTIGVIIEDPNIYQMHKTLFEFNWRKGKEVIRY